MIDRPPEPVAPDPGGLETVRDKRTDPRMIITIMASNPQLLGIRTVNSWGTRQMIGTIFGISSHKIFVWLASGYTVVAVVLAAITADSILGVMATMGGVALGMMLLREKIRDYRVENWKKQAEILDRLLEEERQDHEHTRRQLRAALATELHRPTE